ncbi:hypothetical protein WOLCODRAFT_168135 [Wolfiporia cocos MD-104 SS10]|uniref:Uncharacterized protein n=1 Tax=Wolfiporia cocos (strain MD-104) TaxID=742152 RepID=A0A2H3JC18_WOLCO|nr:hypothetical protein WOLCODRAFT_168135 [Wolfiporia cocos MD-104 SS10]
MDCHSFQAEWNAHPISGPDTNDRSPNDLRLLGQLNHGVYTDDGIDLHPDVLHEHYGTTNQQVRRRRGQTGAGHPPEEDDNSDASNSDSETDSDLGITTQVAATQHSNIRHAAIPVPSNSNPFESEDSEALYFDALDLIRLEGTIPAGFGALPIEHAYEVEEVIRLGRRGRKELVVGLPEHIWRPRIELWAQAVHLLNEFMDAGAGSIVSVLPLEGSLAYSDRHRRPVFEAAD